MVFMRFAGSRVHFPSHPKTHVFSSGEHPNERTIARDLEPQGAGATPEAKPGGRRSSDMCRKDTQCIQANHDVAGSPSGSKD